MELSIVIPTLNRLETLVPCLDSIVRNTHVEFEVIVYANECQPETHALLSSYSCVDTIEDRENSFFTRAVNAGIRRSRGRYVFLLNDDCEIRNDRWFPFFRGLVDRDETIAMAGPVHHPLKELPYGWVEPYASMYTRRTLEEIGLLPWFDETFALWWSDIYHTYRAMSLGFCPFALEPALVDAFIAHRRSAEIGDTVARSHSVLPEDYFVFHGKTLMYERLGIRDEAELAGYYGDRVWRTDEFVDLVRNAG